MAKTNQVVPNKRLSKQFDEFAAANADLIAEYDSTEGTYPFDYCKYEVIEKIATMMKHSRGVDFRTTLHNALTTAIHYQEPVIDSLSSIFNEILQESAGGINTTQQYFKEVGKAYAKYKGDDDLAYCEENREKLIMLNTKMVISVAKKYQNLGLTLPELISAGNLGLCTAWEKYDPSKSQLKDNILAAVADVGDLFIKEDLMKAIEQFLSYGTIKQKFEDKFKPGQTYTKKELISWIDKNIHNAKFSSICMMWIKAYILIEIDNASRVVKKPKSEIYKDKEATGSYQKECLLNLDAPIAGDTETTFADTLGMEDETPAEMDVTEAYDDYKATINKLLEGVSGRDRRVVLLAYGIGLPRALTPKEIADQEGLSVARVSQIRLQALAKMRENAAKHEVDAGNLFSCCTKFR